MNNLQYIVKDNTRFAMHVAVELCEQGDFDSTYEAVRWLMQERPFGAKSTIAQIVGENYCPNCGQKVERGDT